jgi:coenzyme PQQ synthesis protein D (PqqD)
MFNMRHHLQKGGFEKVDLSSLKDPFERAGKIIRYEGAHFLLWKVLTKALSPMGRLSLMSFYRKDLTPPIEKTPTDLALTVCQATKSDIEQLSNMLFFSKHFLREGLAFLNEGIRRLNLGHRCFLGKVGKEIVHYNWIFHACDTLYILKDRYIVMGDDEAFLNDAYTTEPWRGMAIHTIVQNCMLLFLKQQGYRRAYTMVLTSNRSSQKTHHRLGWERSGRMLYFVFPESLKAWICCLSGTLEPFVRKQIPSDGGQTGDTVDDDGKTRPPCSFQENVGHPSVLGFSGQEKLRDHTPADLTQRLRIKSGIVFKKTGDGAFLLEPETGNSKYLNRTATDIFVKLSEEERVEKVIHHLFRQYPGADPKQIRKDVEQVVNELDKSGFIVHADVA